MYIGLHVKYLLFLSYFNKTCIFLMHFWKNSNIKFYENPSSGGPVILCGQRDRQADVSKLIVAFHKFANTSKWKIGKDT
jgi:hypothetical protein